MKKVLALAAAASLAVSSITLTGCQQSDSQGSGGGPYRGTQGGRSPGVMQSAGSMTGGRMTPSGRAESDNPGSSSQNTSSNPPDNTPGGAGAACRSRRVRQR